MRRTFKEQLIAYFFGMLGFYVGLFGSSFLFSMLGLMGFSQGLSWILSFIVGMAVSVIVLVKFEIENSSARQEINKMLDSENKNEVFTLKSLSKQMSLFHDLASLVLMSIPYFLIGMLVFETLIIVVVVLVLVIIAEIILRLPSICLARLVWKKEHIKKN